MNNEGRRANSTYIRRCWSEIWEHVLFRSLACHPCRPSLYITLGIGKHARRESLRTQRDMTFVHAHAG
jgi:hypothetical protein